jgi:hypothetical protein
MPLCNTCTGVLGNIYNRKLRDEQTGNIVATYPPYSTAGRACWICAKHAELLQYSDPEIFEDWLEQPLCVVSKLEIATMVKTDEPGEHPAVEQPTREIHSMFLWRDIKDNPDSGGCQIEITFLRRKG